MVKGYGFSTAQDWHHYFEIIFKNYKVGRMLEFGLGNGTEYLLDHCGEVMSVEISLGEFNKSWYDKCLEKYTRYKNWKPVYVEAGDGIKSAHAEANKTGYPIQETRHLKELSEIVGKTGGGWDLIFVDAGICNRGDIVNLVMGKAPVILAHDSTRDVRRVKKNVYGYNIVEVPGNYEEIHFEDTFCGTTVWVDRTLDGLRSALKARLPK